MSRWQRMGTTGQILSGTAAALTVVLTVATIAWAAGGQYRISLELQGQIPERVQSLEVWRDSIATPALGRADSRWMWQACLAEGGGAVCDQWLDAGDRSRVRDIRTDLTRRSR